MSDDARSLLAALDNAETRIRAYLGDYANRMGKGNDLPPMNEVGGIDREVRRAFTQARAFLAAAPAIDVRDERLALARDALIRTGYFTPEQVGPDIAPRITELWSALHAAPAMLPAIDVERLARALDNLQHEDCLGWDNPKAGCRGFYRRLAKDAIAYAEQEKPE